ncbi:MAG: protein phosphatase domain protein, partial [Gemmatimonadetes bacterium]|nr:protein phosphatase domain protein [Gemmatimonadota bacterium]
VSEEPDLMAVCKTLIDRANEAGGPDNITVIAARFDGDGLSAPSNGDDVGHRVYPLSTDSGQVVAQRRTTSPTLPGNADRRPTLKVPQKDAVPLDAPERLTPTLPIPQVSLRRKTRGSLIALLLLVILLAGATWWVYSTASSVVKLKPAPAAPKQ